MQDFISINNNLPIFVDKYIFLSLKNIYLSTNIGRLLVIDIKSGKTISTLKIDKDKISRPFVSDQNLYLAKDNAIIKLN